MMRMQIWIVGLATAFICGTAGYGSSKYGTCPMAHLLTDCTGDKFKILAPQERCHGDHNCQEKNQKCCKNSCKQYVCANATMPTKPPQVECIKDSEVWKRLKEDPSCQQTSTKFCYKNNCHKCCNVDSTCNPNPSMLTTFEECTQVLCRNRQCWHPAHVCIVNEYHHPVCVCPKECPRSKDTVCGTDGLHYDNECEMKRTACALGDVSLQIAYKGKCSNNDPVRISAQHQTSQTIVRTNEGRIKCGFDGNVVQVIWSKEGLDHLPQLRMSPDKATLDIAQVRKEDAGIYKCSAYDGQAEVMATVNVTVVEPEFMSSVLSRSMCLKPFSRGSNSGKLVIRFYFSAKTKRCEPFVFGGIRGNKNNFLNIGTCMRKCAHAASDICSLPKAPGHCEAYIPSYYYNAKTGECNMFVYGGCQGNANRFPKKDLCEKTCLAKFFCHLLPETGRCRAAMARYFYNSTSKQCEKFTYGGCDGNRNNFPTMEQCETKCEIGQLFHGRSGQGICPPPVMDEPDCSDGTNSVCLTDEDCYDEAKCCFDGCRKTCQRAWFPNRPSIKPGKCPKPAHPDGSVCNKKGNMCDIDVDCPGSQKCCDNGCQRDCVTPEEPLQDLIKPGICPVADYLSPELCESTTDECSGDGDCFGRQKCCDTGCLRECLSTPGSTPKPGRCPHYNVTDPDLCESLEDSCLFDALCPGEQKCCFNGCHKECSEPVEERSQCPKVTKGLDGMCNFKGDECQKDTDCGSNKLCCYNGCQKECVPLKVKTKVAGKCPKPWRKDKDLCDRKGDMCESDDECFAGSKCCFNGCQKDCMKPVILTKCQEKLKEAEDKLSAESPPLGLFVPKCRKDGKYAIEQCHGSVGHCWCVDDEGVEIPDTRVNMYVGSANCSSRVAPGKCPKPTKGQDGRCDFRGDMCLKDSECKPSEKCCFNGCQNDCVKPVAATPCTDAVEELNKRSDGMLLIGAFLPRCKSNGWYEEVQCHGSTGHCWCTDKYGNEVPDTRLRGEPNCAKPELAKVGQNGTCPPPWKGETGICDRMADSCSIDAMCPGSQKCCFSGCQRMCTKPIGLAADVKPGTCPKPWKGADGICDRRGDACGDDQSCGAGNKKCCFNGCQTDCVQPDPCAGKTCKNNGICVPSEDGTTTTCKCQVACSFLYAPLCGSDGKTYPNECVLHATACTEDREIRVAYKGECVSVAPCALVKCGHSQQCLVLDGDAQCVCQGSEHLPCEPVKQPVCGTDKVIYDSLCHLESAACIQNKGIVPALPELCEGRVDRCNKTKCAHPEQQCVEENGHPVCKCPERLCTQEVDPVCGTDGETYTTECVMHLVTCEKSKIVSVDYKGKCKPKPGAALLKLKDACKMTSCSHPLHVCRVIDETPTCQCQTAVTLEYFPVCASDGKMYPNKRAMDVEGCLKLQILTVEKEGSCSSLSDPCEVSLCNHKRHTCRIVDQVATCECSTVCTLEYNPICASDGETYSNLCAKEVVECQTGTKLRILKMGECTEEDLIKPGRCPKPTKGLDGICDRRGDTCDKDTECDGSLKCCFNGCQRDCVGIGLQCPEQCDINAQCVEFVLGGRQCVCNDGYEGNGTQCKANPCSGKECPFHAQCTVNKGKAECVCIDACTANFMPVCGSDGKIYSNDCVLKAEACRQKKDITVNSKDKCRESNPCDVSSCSHPMQRCHVNSWGSASCICLPVPCTRELLPVCGSDGETYANQCEMRRRGCETSKDIKVSSDGRCPNVSDGTPMDPCKDSPCSHPLHRCEVIMGKARCECPLSVTANLQPVCGSDGKTYVNKRSLEVLSCLSNRIITLVQEGECPDLMDPCDISLCSHPKHKCHVVMGVATCVCHEACPSSLEYVCASDGKTYPNQCTMEVESCKTNQPLKVTNPGKCELDECPVFNPMPMCGSVREECSTDDDCSPRQKCCLYKDCTKLCVNYTRSVDVPGALVVVGPTDKPLLDPCSINMCEFPYRCDVESGVAVCTCPKYCTREYAPVCGSDEKTYANMCELQVKSCASEGSIALAINGPCPVSKLVNECPMFNPTPMCGSIVVKCNSSDECPPNENCCLDDRCERRCVATLVLPTPVQGCPVYKRMPACGSLASTCGADEHEPCPDGQKCCVNDVCLKRCMRSSSRLGPPVSKLVNECPMFNPTPMCGSIVVKCNSSDECPPNENCCLDDRCERRCVATLVLPTPEQGCPVYKRMPACGSLASTCGADEPCPDGQKCCVDNSCLKRCMPSSSPLGPPVSEIVNKCPVFNPTPMCASVTVKCKSSDECSPNENCCLDDHCVKRCLSLSTPDDNRDKCPSYNPTPMCSTVSPISCNSGADCAANESCCLDNQCVQKCVPSRDPPPPVKGCPAFDPMPLCGSMLSTCTADDDCPPGQQCCLDDTCTQACKPSIPALPEDDKRDKCPSYNPTPMCSTVSPISCNSGADCAANESCCLDDQCVQKCVPSRDPPPPVKGCPAFNPMPLCASMLSTCTADDDCPPGQQCCLDDTCTQACKPSIPALPEDDKRDKCPSYNPTPMCSTVSPISCNSGADCAANESCCLDDQCVQKCVPSLDPPPPVKGCPAFNPMPLCGSMLSTCTADDDCPPGQQCCLDDTCTQACKPSIPALPEDDKRDKCPSYNPTPMCSTVSPISCNSGADCAANESCCLDDQCVQKCVPSLDPPPPVKGCPAFDPMPLCGSVLSTCTADDDCPPGQQCCLDDSCNQACKPSIPALLKGTNPCSLECADPYSKCEVVDEKPECVCPAMCTRELKQVCGTNRKTYDNECTMKRDACENGMMIRVKYDGKCRDKPGYCPSVDPMECKEEMKIDECDEDSNCSKIMKCCYNACSKRCTNPLPVPNHGPSPAKQSVEEIIMTCPAFYKGQDGTCDRMGNLCEENSDCSGRKMCCFNGCQKECLEPDTAPKSDLKLRPSCSTAKCGFYSTCVEERGEVRCECPGNCTLDDAPVCGSDGNTYSNECNMQAKACTTKTSITLAIKGECKDACNLDPVAGPCMAYIPSFFFNATSQKCEEFVYGGCKGNKNRFPTLDTCTQACRMELPHSDDPCKPDTCDYYSKCEADKEGGATCVCPTACEQLDRPVCGSDGDVYGNECELKVKACQNQVLVEVVGGPEKCGSKKRSRCQGCPKRSRFIDHFCKNDFAMLVRLKKIEVNEDKAQSKLTVSVNETFKGPPTHGNIEVFINKNLGSCTCKGLEPRPHLLLMAGNIAEGVFYVDESSYVRYSHHLLRRKAHLLAKTQHTKCEGKDD